ncbi:MULTISPECIES: nitrite reductase (NAD(P)H) small subunit [Dermacoccus]|uniref:Nitrite reductase (NAD(P)H) small subunit n=2 Tax=Dermacoccus TaxID=57495 RepID=A0A417ZBW0_9MICO|nr:nitrite reductase (NAD(P)H) small subunit [Dermacoccus abyssi]RHW48152.1 nitrite reductase (NAD(P)H) small subunit [Dermacoccus abyssi]
MSRPSTSTESTSNVSVSNAPDLEGWTRACDADRLVPERAVAALAPDGAQVAVVRTADGRLFAVGHHDPYALANVIARGVVGTRTVADETASEKTGQEATGQERVVDVIQSPLYKQAFDLATGEDVEDRSVSLGTWAVRERDGVIELGERTSEAGHPERTTR